MRLSRESLGMRLSRESLGMRPSRESLGMRLRRGEPGNEASTYICCKLIANLSSL